MIIVMKLNCNKHLSCAGGSVTLHMLVICYETQNNIKVKEERQKL